MKKSNALMISYLIFLFISFLAKIFFDWSGLEKIALAASIASFFFAFSDYTNWSMTHTKNSFNTLKDALLKMILTDKKLVVFLEKKLEENDKVISLLNVPREPDHPFNDIFEYVTETSNMYRNKIDSFTESKLAAEKLNEKVESIYTPKIKKLNNIELILLVLGFTLFFVVLVFETVYTLLLDCSDIITVSSFAVILLTYFLRDIYEDKDKKQFDEILSNSKNNEEKVEDIILTVNQDDELEQFKKYIYIIRTGEHMERKNKISGENENGR